MMYNPEFWSVTLQLMNIGVGSALLMLGSALWYESRTEQGRRHLRRSLQTVNTPMAIYAAYTLCGLAFIAVGVSGPGEFTITELAIRIARLLAVFAMGFVVYDILTLSALADSEKE